MAKVFITLTGTKYYHGNEFLKPGMKVKLTKEPDNEYDKEAIKVSMKGIGINIQNPISAFGYRTCGE